MSELPFKIGLLSRMEFDRLIDHLSTLSIQHAILTLLDVDRSKEIPLEQQEPVFQKIEKMIAGMFPNEYSCRIGRDCYAVLFLNKNVSYFDVANQKNMLQNEWSNSQAMPITFSMGMASYPSTSNEFADILPIASEALLLAKKRGVNQVEIPPEQPMKMKACYFRLGQLEKLASISKRVQKSESYLLRRALDEYLRKLDQIEDGIL